MKENDVIKMEFLITLNDNIVIQRYFNVRGYNPTAKSSLDVSMYLKDFVEVFQYEQKMRTVVYIDRKSTRLNSSHSQQSRMPSSA